ncbi:MAG: hypothetical protein KDB88_10425 [Flavobacteriales bacterium]|nr:hypothetical protein [Flavobacteriales bacterium]
MSHCTPCHHEGGAGHFSLMTYADAYPKRVDIRDYTQARAMPPWPPDPEYARHAHERVLTQEEIDIIAAWVNGNAPEGDPQNTPTPPVYDSEWVIDQPDISVIMEEYVIPSSSADLYRCFVMPSGNSVDRFITGLEVVPGNTEVVHHVLVYQDTTGAAQALDDADPQPGYTSFGGIGVSGARLVGLWVPGASPYFTPQGMGIKLFADADIVIQVHYPAGSDFQLDSTRVNLQLSTAPFIRNLAIDAVLDHVLTITDGPLIIPPDQVKTFHAQFTSPIPATITAIGPHAHLIAQSMKAFAVTPQNDTIPLIDIPQWDFRWQGLYEFQRPIYLPAGTTLYGEATYDNTAANPNNPNDPPDWVFLGEATTDEMMLFYFAYTLGFPGDTAIVVDTASHAAHHLDCEPAISLGLAEEAPGPAFELWPVPTQDALFISSPEPGELHLIDQAGRTVRCVVVKGSARVAVADLARGMYVAEFQLRNKPHVQRTKVLLE